MTPLPLPSGFLVVPVGQLPRGLVAEIRAVLEAVYQAPAEVGPAQGKPDFAFNKDRQQYHSAAVLRRLEAVRPHGRDVAVLGVADVDLFVPDLPFVLGESDRDARTALVSIFRLKGGEGSPLPPEQVAHRSRVEAVHAAGELLGLSSCHDGRCCMFLSRAPIDCDRKGNGLCAPCRGAIGLP